MPQIHGLEGLRTRASALIFALAVGATPLACNKGSAPVILDPGDQTGDKAAVVGRPFMLDIFASDADGDRLEFDFEARGVPGIEQTASMTVAPDGHGVFTFTPTAEQVGAHLFDFIVSDGTFKTVLPILIEVRGAAGTGAAPIFRKPLGGGTVLDLENSECTAFEILIEDADDAQVELMQLPPTIAGSQLDAAPNGLEGDWSWCPDRQQRNGANQYRLVLGADDGEHQTTKDFVIVLRAASGEGCPGEAPVISHEPRDFTTLADLKVEARITDDQGLKNPPLVFYAYEDPRSGNDIMFDRLQIAQMELSDGTRSDGTWTGYIPNPTVDTGEGSSATVYYLIEAVDDDDPTGDCDHRTDHPASGMHVVSVTNNGQGGGGLCEPCSSDVQCGGGSDLCVSQGSSNFCGTACSSCPTGYTCASITSVSGTAESQCVPESGSCGSSSGMCQDDSGEDDDTPEQAIAQGYITPGTYNAKLCPGDPDWYLVRLDVRATVTALLEGDNPPDMDLRLVNAQQAEIDNSSSTSSSEIIEGQCLAPGDYFVVVDMFELGAKEGSYTLEFDIDPSSCSSASACCGEQEGSGCPGSSTVESCVCALDSFCCSSKWDATCAAQAILACDLQCAPNDNQGNCCSANGTPGCQHDAIELCGCFWNSSCCDGAVWTQSCVDTVNTQCGGC